MRPTYLTINEAVAWIRQSSGEPFSIEWLLQYALEGKLQLFALTREPLYTCVAEFVDADYWLSRGKVGRIYRSDFDSPENLSLSKANALAGRPEIKPMPIPLPSNGHHRYRTGRICFSVGEYVPLQTSHVGQILASTARVANISSILVNGKHELVCTQDIVIKGEKELPKLSVAWWKVTENDLYVKTSEIASLLKSAEEAAHQTKSKIGSAEQNPKGQPHTGERGSDLAAIGVSKEEVLRVAWPLRKKINFSRALAHPPAWLKPARISPGHRGKHSSRWNIAKIGTCLIKTSPHKAWMVKQQEIEDLITESFPEWLDELKKEIRFLYE
jgi:hypothetical protein